MMHDIGYGWSTGWLMLSIAFSLLLILAFIVGEKTERRLLEIAINASQRAEPALPDNDATFLQRKASPIGTAAFFLSVVTLFLMVFKPF